MLASLTTETNEGYCKREMFNLGYWHPEQRELRTSNTKAKFLISGVGTPYKGGGRATLQLRTSLSLVLAYLTKEANELQNWTKHGSKLATRNQAQSDEHANFSDYARD